MAVDKRALCILPDGLTTWNLGALICLGVSSVVFLVGYITPEWVIFQEFGHQATQGLWRNCDIINGTRTCVPIYGNEIAQREVMYYTARVTMSVSLCLVLIGVWISLAVACLKPHRRWRPLIPEVLCFLITFISITVGLSMYAWRSKVMLQDSRLGYSFICTAISVPGYFLATLFSILDLLYGRDQLRPEPAHTLKYNYKKEHEDPELENYGSVNSQ